MRNIAFVIGSFRITQVEQYDALSEAVEGKATIVGIQIASSDPEYPFGEWTGEKFSQITLYPGPAKKHNLFVTTAKIVREIVARKVKSIFFTHYHHPHIFLSACILRILGKKVYIVNDSKFDDYRRHFWREVGKYLLYAPYQGALAASPRSADYLRFLGVPEERIRLNFYTSSVRRVRESAGAPPAPDGTPHAERNFICVARLVPKKNHMMLLDAYAAYAGAAGQPRRLILCGSGPLESAIDARINELGLGALITLTGNLPAPEIAQQLSRGLCLLLPSIEEQYGIAVLEAQAMGLPIILSDNCGARDRQVRSAVNGFVVEPDNPTGLAYFMQCLAEDEALWTRMSREAQRYADRGDVDKFVEAVLSLT